MLNKLKKNNKKGFTLVELIVVLVILAILAALLIPALTGYIEKARQKQIVAQTRQAVMAAQTLVDEEYGKNTPTYTNVSDTAIKTLAELPTSIIITFDASDTDYVSNGKVLKLVLSDGTTTCTYDTSATELYTIN